MTAPSRRSFLKHSATTTLSAATLAAFPPSIRKALAIPAHNETGTIKDVKHVVILMQENRGFDHYFGTFKGVRGFGDRFTIPLPDGRKVWEQLDATGAVDRPYHLDQAQGNAQRTTGTPHTWVDCHQAWDGGRMEQWARYKQKQSMGYFDQAEIPFQRALAEAFTLCDAYHCAMQTGTHANRMMHMTGTNGAVANAAFVNNFSDDFSVASPASAFFDWTTYAERLEAAGVSWKVYQNILNTYGCNPLLGFRQYREANEAMPAARQVKSSGTQAAQPVYEPGDARIQPLMKGYANTMPTTDSDPNTSDRFIQAFRDDVLNGRLPEVSWIIPTDVYSEHPGPSSPAQGAWFVQQFLDALTAVPEVWSKTVLLVNYDENDGFFDHLPPAAPPSPLGDGTYAGKTTLRSEDLGVEYYTHDRPRRPDTHAESPGQPARDGRPYGPGPRVPLWVISPWSRGGWVNSQNFDHTSILRFLEARFGVKEPNISAYRRAVNGDLTSAFGFAQPDLQAPPTLQGWKTKTDADALRAAQQALPQIQPDPGRGLPVQASGLRPSRALPYELHATAATDAVQDVVALNFANTGRAAAIFHVYDQLHLDRLPRRYAVEAGLSLSDVWAAGRDDAGRYDLWVLGPNGFHRRFKGDLAAQRAGHAPAPEVRLHYDPANGGLRLEARNDGSGPLLLKVRSNRVYGALSAVKSGEPGGSGQALGAGTEWALRLDGRGTQSLYWNLDATGWWYDVVVTCDADASFIRRLAGRMETGRDSVSDPGMGLADQF
ncbi:MAG: phospholipase C, phosphocholine-specific [Xenophilus sp.]